MGSTKTIKALKLDRTVEQISKDWEEGKNKLLSNPILKINVDNKKYDFNKCKFYSLTVKANHEKSMCSKICKPYGINYKQFILMWIMFYSKSCGRTAPLITNIMDKETAHKNISKLIEKGLCDSAEVPVGDNIAYKYALGKVKWFLTEKGIDLFKEIFEKVDS